MAKTRKPAPKPDQHAGKRLVVWLDEAYHQRIEQLARKGRRPKSEQVKIMFEKFFTDEGIPIPSEEKD